MHHTEVQSGQVPKPPFSLFVISEVSSEQKESHEQSYSEIVMVDLAFGDDFFEQTKSWDDIGTIISGI